VIYGIIIWLLTLIIDLWTDYRLYLKYRNTVRPKGYGNHVRGALLRVIPLAVASFFAKWLSPVLLFGYWILFNGFYNILTGQKWFRKGTTAKLDKLPVWVPYVGLAVSAITYVLIKQHELTK
jgi:hypothetical protein